MATVQERTELSPRGPYAWSIQLDGVEQGLLISESVWAQQWRVHDNFGRNHEFVDFPHGEEGRKDMADAFLTFLELEGK